MQKPKNARAKRVRNLVAICSLIAIVLSASTYAWFIGMRTVNVSNFDVEIAATDSLLLSLDGETWDTTVTISQGQLDTVSYDGHTNSWGGAGLKPMSSVGEMDVDASRMKLFEKASLTPTPGGFRLMASRVNNFNFGTPGDLSTLEEEPDGYVVFDLFIKNFTGTQYIPEYNELDEESIYLTAGPDGSKVTVASDGVANTGIENSVRVAFAQIGRVSGDTTDPATITSIECTPFAGEEGQEKPTVVGELTGICRTAQIWEPNDIKHVTNAISWYDTSCRERTGGDVRDPLSFKLTDHCIALTNDVAYPTYAVKEAIASSNNVDIYDGAAYNKYINSSQLYAYDTFTDTERDDEGTARTEFMSLAPNSITKIRVYIYIEGQDVDNYDFASIGKKISVQFGFTKERFNESDIAYSGAPTNPGTDTSKPVITMNPADPEVPGVFDVTIEQGTPYKDEGATAIDPDDGEGHTDIPITNWIKTINPVNYNEPGVYYVTYNVSDWQGNYAAQVVRKVTVTPTP